MLNKLCRLCGTLSSIENLKQIKENDNLISKVLFYFQINLNSEKIVLLCYTCIDILNKITEFYEKIKKAQEQFSTLYENAIKIENDENYFEYTTIKTEFKQKNLPKKQDTLWKDYDWKCVICNKNLSNINDFRMHFNNEHKTSAIKYSCMDCSKIYDKFPPFKLHVKSHRHKYDFACSTCGKYFFLQRYLLLHKECHSEKYNYNCDKCKKQFRTKASLRIHKRSHLPSDLKFIHECKICNKKFSKKPNLTCHIKTLHMNQKDYICDECGKKFAQKCALEKHMQTIHSDLTPYHCKLCPKMFKTNFSLTLHTKTHAGIRPHMCKICGKTFGRKGTLTRHETVHSDLLPFQCSHCQKCFRIKQLLKIHLRQHTGEKPYSCHECDKHFSDSSNFIKHMRAKHNVKSIAKNLLYNKIISNDDKHYAEDIKKIETNDFNQASNI